MRQSKSRLALLRTRIDHIDERILRLLMRRNSIAKEIGTVKHMIGLPIHDVVREDSLLRRRTQMAERMKLDSALVRRMFVSIMAMAKREERN